SRLCASPPPVSPNAGRASRRPVASPASVRCRPRLRAQPRSASTERSSSPLVRVIWRAMSWIFSWSANSAVRGGSGSSRRIHQPNRRRTGSAISMPVAQVRHGERLEERERQRGSDPLEIDQLSDSLAMVRRIAKRELGAFGTLEVEVQVVLPREADATVELDAGG